MSRTRYMQTLEQPSGIVLTVKTGAPWEVRLRGLATPVTFYSAETGGSAITGDVAHLTTRNGRVEPVATVGGELWLDSGISYDEYTTANGQAVTGSNPLVKVGANGSLSPSVERSIGFPVDAPTGTAATDTAAIQAALTAANAAGGGEVWLREGTYAINAALTIYSNTALVGKGMGVTVLRLANSGNVDIVKSNGFDALTGGGTTGGITNFALRDFSIDGNSDNNTSLGGIKLYGYFYRVENVEVSASSGPGFFSEWSPTGLPTVDADGDTPPLEAKIDGLFVHDCDAEGIKFAGPHDTAFSRIFPYRNGGKGFWLTANGTSCVISDSHSWGSTQTYAWYLEAQAKLINCIGEGASTSQVMVGASDCEILGGAYFYNQTSAGTGIEIGDGTHTTIARTHIDTQIARCHTAGISFNSDGGQSRIFANIYAPGGDSAPVAFTGTPAANTSIEFVYSNNVTFPAANQGGTSYGNTLAVRRFTPSGELASAQGWHIADGTKLARMNTSATKRMQFADGNGVELFTDQFSTSGGSILSTVAGEVKTTTRHYGIDGLTTKTVAGVVSDASFATAPRDGTIAIDTTNFQIYVRIGGVWKKTVALT